MKYSVCLLAAGRGSRTNLSYNKVFYKLTEDCTILDQSLSIFLNDVDCEEIILTCAAHEEEYMNSLYHKYDRVHIVVGGDTRQDSVSRALDQVHSAKVFIHDAARPFLKKEHLEALKQTMETEQACLLMVPSVDTVKVVEDGYVKQTLDRSILYQAQTPQCFDTELIRHCHALAKQEGVVLTDDAHVVEKYSSIPIKAVLGDSSNKKVTLPSDL